jgi:hypothetical protein
MNPSMPIRKVNKPEKTQMKSIPTKIKGKQIVSSSSDSESSEDRSDSSLLSLDASSNNLSENEKDRSSSDEFSNSNSDNESYVSQSNSDVPDRDNVSVSASEIVSEASLPLRILSEMFFSGEMEKLGTTFLDHVPDSVFEILHKQQLPISWLLEKVPETSPSVIRFILNYFPREVTETQVMLLQKAQQTQYDLLLEASKLQQTESKLQNEKDSQKKPFSAAFNDKLSKFGPWEPVLSWHRDQLLREKGTSLKPIQFTDPTSSYGKYLCWASSLLFQDAKFLQPFLISMDKNDKNTQLRMLSPIIRQFSNNPQRYFRIVLRTMVCTIVLLYQADPYWSSLEHTSDATYKGPYKTSAKYLMDTLESFLLHYVNLTFEQSRISNSYIYLLTTNENLLTAPIMDLCQKDYPNFLQNAFVKNHSSTIFLNYLHVTIKNNPAYILPVLQKMDLQHLQFFGRDLFHRASFLPFEVYAYLLTKKDVITFPIEWLQKLKKTIESSSSSSASSSSTGSNITKLALFSSYDREHSFFLLHLIFFQGIITIEEFLRVCRKCIFREENSESLDTNDESESSCSLNTIAYQKLICQHLKIFEDDKKCQQIIIFFRKTFEKYQHIYPEPFVTWLQQNPHLKNLHVVIDPTYLSVLDHARLKQCQKEPSHWDLSTVQSIVRTIKKASVKLAKSDHSSLKELSMATKATWYFHYLAYLQQELIPTEDNNNSNLYEKRYLLRSAIENIWVEERDYLLQQPDLHTILTTPLHSKSSSRKTSVPLLSIYALFLICWEDEQRNQVRQLIETTGTKLGIEHAWNRNLLFQLGCFYADELHHSKSNSYVYALLNGLFSWLAKHPGKQNQFVFTFMNEYINYLFSFTGFDLNPYIFPDKTLSILVSTLPEIHDSENTCQSISEDDMVHNTISVYPLTVRELIAKRYLHLVPSNLSSKNFAYSFSNMNISQEHIWEMYRRDVLHPNALMKRLLIKDSLYTNYSKLSQFNVFVTEYYKFFVQRILLPKFLEETNAGNYLPKKDLSSEDAHLLGVILAKITMVDCIKFYDEFHPILWYLFGNFNDLHIDASNAANSQQILFNYHNWYTEVTGYGPNTDEAKQPHENLIPFMRKRFVDYWNVLCQVARGFHSVVQIRMPIDPASIRHHVVANLSLEEKHLRSFLKFKIAANLFTKYGTEHAKTLGEEFVKGFLLLTLEEQQELLVFWTGRSFLQSSIHFSIQERKYSDSKKQLEDDYLRAEPCNELLVVHYETLMAKVPKMSLSECYATLIRESLQQFRQLQESGARFVFH